MSVKSTLSKTTAARQPQTIVLKKTTWTNVFLMIRGCFNGGVRKLSLFVPRHTNTATAGFTFTTVLQSPDQIRDLQTSFQDRLPRARIFTIEFNATYVFITCGEDKLRLERDRK